MSLIASPRYALLVLIATPLFAIGCGGSSAGKVNVSGNVTVDGNPLEAGLITFTCMGGNYSQAAGQIVNGRYSVDNVEPGKNQILVSVGGSSGGSDVDKVKMAQLGSKMRGIGQMARNDPQRAARLRAEARKSAGVMANPVVVSEETTGNKQVQEISADRSQTIDVSLETVKARKRQ